MVDGDGRQLKLDLLSKGTQQQLYLAIRLALVAEFAKRTEPPAAQERARLASRKLSTKPGQLQLQLQMDLRGQLVAVELRDARDWERHDDYIQTAQGLIAIP